MFFQCLIAHAQVHWFVGLCYHSLCIVLCSGEVLGIIEKGTKMDYHSLRFERGLYLLEGNFAAFYQSRDKNLCASCCSPKVRCEEREGNMLTIFQGARTCCSCQTILICSSSAQRTQSTPIVLGQTHRWECFLIASSNSLEWDKICRTEFKKQVFPRF